jgi:hypothetical protein
VVKNRSIVAKGISIGEMRRASVEETGVGNISGDISGYISRIKGKFSS